MNHIRRRKQSHLRQSLFNRNPHCYWCNKVTRLKVEGHKLGHDHATVDHIISRNRAINLAEYQSHRNKVLACHQCNQTRNTEEQKRLLRESGK